MNKLIHFRLEVPIYNHYVDVLICGSEKEWERRMKALGYGPVFIFDSVNYMRDAYAGIIRPGYKYAPSFPIFFSFLPKMHSPHDVSVVAHELLHATAEILRGRGLQFDPSSEEAYTYLLDTLTKMFWTELKRKQ